jgi:hypothetical protein
MARHRKGYIPRGEHQDYIAGFRAPHEPEYRPSKQDLPPAHRVVPYLGPRSLEEWRAALREAVANDPVTREMLGVDHHR